MVKVKIVDQLKKSDVGLFCLKCDETRDASNTEDTSLCFVSWSEESQLNIC